jgi:hypothetical protein
MFRPSQESRTELQAPVRPESSLPAWQDGRYHALPFTRGITTAICFPGTPPATAPENGPSARNCLRCLAIENPRVGHFDSERTQASMQRQGTPSAARPLSSPARTPSHFGRSVQMAGSSYRALGVM